MRFFNQLILAAAFLGSAGSAQAALKFCNETTNVQSVAIGYKGPSEWMSEGWWNIDPGECATVIGGDLQKRYYYYRAEVNGGDFAGGNYMFCTTPEEFEIVGDTNCDSRGFTSESFREIDTGETATDFTFTLVGNETPPRSDDPRPTPDTPIGDTGQTGLNICNSTNEIQSVAIGYENEQGFLSEGWWNIDPDDCALVIAGELQKRYYYYRAEVEAGPFEGEGFLFCTTPEVFSIQGDADCESRGYDTESFSEIDTGPMASGYTFYISADGISAPPPDTTPPGTTDTPPPASGAGLRICNDTARPQSVAIGYEGAEDWTSEGWWNLEPDECVAPPLDGVNRRYLYYRAEFSGEDFTGENYFFCTTPEPFVIVGDAECEARGYEREDFREIDTGGTEGEYTLVLGAGETVETAPPEDDRVEVPNDGPKTTGDTDERPGDVTPDADEPEEPSFDFGIPGEDDAEEPAPDTPAEDTLDTPEVTDTPQTDGTDTPVDTPTDTPDTPTEDTPPDFESDVEDTPLIPELDDTPEVDDTPTSTRRGGSRGG